MCDPDGALGLDGLDALASLVDKSLIRQLPDAAGQPRFGMLETIREYAVERLIGERRRQRRRDCAIRTTSRRSRPGLSRSCSALAKVNGWTASMPIVTTSGPRCRTPRTTVEPSSRLGWPRRLWRFWQQRGHLAEGRAALEGLLALPAAAARTPARAQCSRRSRRPPLLAGRPRRGGGGVRRGSRDRT